MCKIESAKYEGYIWYSNQKAPNVYDGEKMVEEMVLDKYSTPFIIEGNLWDKEHNLSIMIRYVDGAYLIRRTKVSEDVLNGTSCDAMLEKNLKVATTVKEYLPHPSIKDVDALRFLQYWEPKEDESCEGMPVLQPSKLVFIGFKK